MSKKDLFTFNRVSAEKEPKYSWLHLVSLQTEDGSPRVLVTCILRDGVVTLTGEASLVNQLQKGLSLGPNKIVFPNDGEAFLNQLMSEYRHPFLFATPISSGNEVLSYKP